MSIETLDTKADLERFVQSLLERPGFVSQGAVHGLPDEVTNLQSQIDDLLAVGGIPGAVFDVKGDLIAGSGSDIYGRLAAGANGTFLKADSSQTLGLIWAGLAISDISGLSATLAAKQDADSDLAAIAAIATTAYGRALLALADGTAARSYIGLGTIATQNANGVAITGGSITGITDLTVADGGTGASTASGARTNLGLVIGTDVQAFDAATVKGPASATADDLASYNGTTGKLIKDSGAAAANVPSAGEKLALVGTDGTPGSTNRYVTDSDPIRRPTELKLNAAALSLGLWGYWTLGSGGAGLTDQTGNGRNGTANGGVTIGGGASLNSESGGSTTFDGVDDFISFGVSPFDNSKPLTLFGWTRASSPPPSFGTLFSSSGATHPLWVASAASDIGLGGIRADADLASGPSITKNAWVRTDKPNFFAIVFDPVADIIKLYSNGVFLGSVASALAFDAGIGNLLIGKRGDAGAVWLSGQASHIGVAQKELSPETLAWLSRIGFGQGKEWGIVSTLPPSSSAIPGDTCTYAADMVAGVYWRLIFDGQGSFPWKYLGGPPLSVEANPSRTSASTTYVAPATDPMVIGIPLAGDYDIEIKSRIDISNSERPGFHSYSVGVTAALDNWAAMAGATNVLNVRGQGVSTAKNRHTGIVQGANIAEKIRVDTPATVGVQYRRLRVTPVRVG